MGEQEAHILSGLKFLRKGKEEGDEGQPFKVLCEIKATHCGLSFVWRLVPSVAL